MPSQNKVRSCTVWGSAFTVAGGTRPVEVCTIECRRARQASHARAHYAKRKAELERLKAIVEQLQSVVAA